MTDASWEDTPTIGDNRPPADLLLGDALREKLRADHADLLTRQDELIAAGARAPIAVTDDEIDKKMTDFVRQLQSLASVAEKTRVGVKEPYLEGSRGVDEFFKSISDPILMVKREIEARLTLYKRAKADRERREREELARVARETEERARREADEAAAKIKTEADLAAAIAAEREAQHATADSSKAEKAATVKAAEMSRARGEYGGVSSLRTFWTFDSLDRATIDLEALRAHIPIDALERAVNAFIKAGGREIEGARIFEQTTTVVR